MEYYNKELCVTHDELTTGENPIIKPSALKLNVYRQNIRVARRGGGEGSYALFVYSSLPDKYKAKWVAKYGEPEDTMRKERLKAYVVMDEKAREWFEAYEYDLNGVQTHLKEEVIAEYTTNASVLNALIECHQRMGVETRMRGNPRRDLWGGVQNLCESLRDLYGHTLPANLARLKEKVSK